MLPEKLFLLKYRLKPAAGCLLLLLPLPVQLLLLQQPLALEVFSFPPIQELFLGSDAAPLRFFSFCHLLQGLFPQCSSHGLPFQLPESYQNQ